jgi:hypothetical protein
LEAVVPKEACVFDLQARRSLHALPRIVEYLRDRRPAAMLASQTHLNLLAIWARMWGGVPTRLVLSEHIALDAASRNASSWKERIFPVGSARGCSTGRRMA